MAGMHLKFPSEPLIYRFIEQMYLKCSTTEDFVRLTHALLAQEEKAEHQVNIDALHSTSCAIYSLITKRSWESLPNKIEI